MKEGKPVKNVAFPVDALSEKIVFTPGRGRFTADTRPAREKDKDQDLIICNIYKVLEKEGAPAGVEAIGIDQFDWRCILAIAAIYIAGNTETSARQVFIVMGNKGEPSPEQTRRILARLDGMLGVKIEIDNTLETSYMKYGLVRKRANLLPIQITERYATDGKLAGHAITIQGVPLLIEFAIARKSCITLPVEALRSELRQTEANLGIEHYLMRRIAAMVKKPKLSRKILYSAVIEKCLLDGRRVNRVKEKVLSILEAEKGVLIKSYRVQKDGVVLILSKNTDEKKEAEPPT